MLYIVQRRTDAVAKISIKMASSAQLASADSSLFQSIARVHDRYNRLGRGPRGTAVGLGKLQCRPARTAQPIGLGTASMDTWITTKVRSQLLASDEVKSSNVKVTTDNGEVFLMGLVSDKEAKAAARIASQVSGVKHVTTAFTFLK